VLRRVDGRALATACAQLGAEIGVAHGEDDEFGHHGQSASSLSSAAPAATSGMPPAAPPDHRRADMEGLQQRDAEALVLGQADEDVRVCVGLRQAG